MPKKKNTNITKYGIAFTAGLIIGLIIAVLFLCPVLPGTCPLDEECEDSCLLIHLDDALGNPLPNTYIAIFDSDEVLIDDGYTDAQGDFLVNATIFGCGDGSVKLYAEGTNVQGPWASHIWLSNSEGDCTIDEVTTCCETTWVVAFEG